MHDPIEFMKATALVVPFVLLQFIGLVLSIFWRSRLGRGWIAAAVGFLFLLIGNVATILYFMWIFWLYDSASQGYRVLEIVDLGRGVIQSGLGFLGYILLLIALFIRREPQPAK